MIARAVQLADIQLANQEKQSPVGAGECLLRFTRPKACTPVASGWGIPDSRGGRERTPRVGGPRRGLRVAHRVFVEDSHSPWLYERLRRARPDAMDRARRPWGLPLTSQRAALSCGKGDGCGKDDCDRHSTRRRPRGSATSPTAARKRELSRAPERLLARRRLAPRRRGVALGCRKRSRDARRRQDQSDRAHRGSRTLEIGRQQQRRVARVDDCFADRGREGYAGGRLLTAGRARPRASNARLSERCWFVRRSDGRAPQARVELPAVGSPSCT